ncbi:MAG: hypothetical protein ACU85U_08335 [Gammaproteobacteria bacterium]|jgi:hypothetical protein
MITTTFEAAFAILTIEFALLAPVMAFFTLRGARSAEAATTSEATELVSKVADTEDARRSALETVFREKYQYEGDELDAAVDEFMGREKAFYNAVVGAVLGRGDSKISDINDELTKVVAPWISITPKNMVDAKSAEAVATHKDRIEIELGHTKETLEKMMSEYNRAFRKSADQNEPEPDTEAAQTSVKVSPEPEVGDELEELDYKTEELHDLDDVLEAIEARKTENEAPADEAVTAADAMPIDESIVNLDDDFADIDAEFAADAAAAVVEKGDPVEELDSPDELDDDVFGDTPVKRAGKPMTADDLDELMESLDADETESA